MQTNVFIKPDVSKIVGIGHLMRSVSLADAFIEKGIVPIFLLDQEHLQYQEMISEQVNAEFIILPPGNQYFNEFNKSITKYKPIAIVLDGHNYGFEFQSKIDRKKTILVCMGWINDRSYLSDIIINPNIWANKSLYSREVLRSKILLLGVKYVALRKSIRMIHPKVDYSKCKNILLTFGGGEQSSFAFVIYEALKHLPFKFMIPSLTVSPPNGYPKSRNLIYLNHHNYIETMKEVDLAICAAGSTCWELSYVGVPYLTYILAKDQELNAQELNKKGITTNLGWVHSFNKHELLKSVDSISDDCILRKNMGLKGSKLIDGRGAERVVNTILKQAGGESPKWL